MGFSRTPALMLGSIRMGEANRLVTFLTPSRGRLSGMAYNARRPNRRFGSALELFTHCDLVLDERRPHHYIDIRQAALIQGFPAIRRDLALIEGASRMVWLCRAFLPEAAPHPVAFALLAEGLDALESGQPLWSAQCLFELGLLRDVGYEPRLDRCVRCPPAAAPIDAPLFSVAAGGLLCVRCASTGMRGDTPVIHGRPLPVSRGAVAFLRQANRLGLDRGGRLRPSAAIRDEVSRLLQHYLHWLLDQQPVAAPLPPATTKSGNGRQVNNLPVGTSH